jgi:uncharacterized protein YcbX
MATHMATLAAIYRYPVKGLSAEPLPRSTLTPGETILGDRIYAIENGPSGFDPAAPAHLPKQRFLMLMRNERLATLRAAFDQTTRTLAVARRPSSPAPTGGAGRQEASGDLETPEGRAAIERFFAAFCADEMRGPAKVLSARGHSFSDVARKVVSIINLASVRALEEAAGAAIDPLRFRANLYVEGWPAWREFDLIGQTLAVGAARLEPVKRIVRCAATNVDPQTGRRDLTLPQTLLQTYGHADCGVYAEVVEGGDIAVGDTIGVV